MEDVVVTSELLAVLDGHNGRECADFVGQRLSSLVHLPQHEWAGVFARLDDEFRELNLPSGSTCVAAVLRSGSAEVANLGDSRAVLLRGGRMLQQTEDHKPSAPVERERISRCGGTVEDGGPGPSRVGGVAVSRAFGTYVGPLRRAVLKDPQAPHADRLISCVPELFVWEVQVGDVIVLACDGVWDVLSSEDVAGLSALVCQGVEDMCELAQRICSRALEHSTDNVSCVVAQLGGATPAPPHHEEPARVYDESSPSFNDASREEQLAICEALAYGETLIEILAGLGTDSVFPGLWLGQVGDACYWPFLKFAQVTRVVNCAAEVERPDVGGIGVHVLAWRDSAEQGKAERTGNFRRLRAATRFIHEQLDTGEVVLVHCVQGVSRSAAVVVAFLMEWRGISMDDAISLVRRKHPGALKPFPFQDMLIAFGHVLNERHDSRC